MAQESKRKPPKRGLLRYTLSLSNFDTKVKAAPLAPAPEMPAAPRWISFRGMSHEAGVFESEDADSPVAPRRLSIRNTNRQGMTRAAAVHSIEHALRLSRATADLTKTCGFLPLKDLTSATTRLNLTSHHHINHLFDLPSGNKLRFALRTMPSARERTLSGTSELCPLPATNAFQPATNCAH